MHFTICAVVFPPCTLNLQVSHHTMKYEFVIIVHFIFSVSGIRLIQIASHTDTPGTPSDPLQHGAASAPADLITCVCTVSVSVCLLSSASEVCNKIAEGEAEQSFVFAPVLFSSERELFVGWNNCRENTFRTFSYGISCGKWKGEKNAHTHTHTVRDPPITVTCQQYGATHTYTLTHTHQGVSNTVYCCLEWLRDEFRRSPGSVLIVWRVLFSLLTKQARNSHRNSLFPPFLLLLLIKLQLHAVCSVHQNAFSSEISMRHEMDSGNAIKENQLGEEESKTESDTHIAFSVPFRSLQDFL